MEIYSKEIVVTALDLDELNHVNNVRYVQWIQDIAKEHWFKNSTTEMNTNHFWVVASHHIDYKSSAVLNDVISLKTYVTKSDGIMSIRVVEMHNKKTNKLIVKSETKWCFMDKQSKRPTRIPNEISSLFY